MVRTREVQYVKSLILEFAWPKGADGKRGPIDQQVGNT